MTEVISVRFRNRGKAYFFAPDGHQVEAGQYVVVETAKGLGCGECVQKNHYVDEGQVKPPLQPVVRLATEEDLRVLEQHREKEQNAFRLCKQKIAEHKLDMKLVDVEYNFEGNKILFFFTSDGRVDFRDLVKDLASVFKTRIELRQIGVRDEARMMGGLGICGKPFCCAQFLDDFQSVSIKMAKTQSLSLNPTKISGTCGRLMCCLRYEQAAYEDLVKKLPKHNAAVNTPDGPGTVSDVSLLRQRVKVRLEDQPDTKVYELEELGLNGEPAPARMEKKAEPEEEDELAKALRRLGGPDSPQEKRGPKPRQEQRGRGEQKSRQEQRGKSDKKRQEPRAPRPEGGKTRPEQKPRQEAPRPAEGQKADGGEAAKKRRRPRHRKPRSGGQGKQSTQNPNSGTPKTE